MADTLPGLCDKRILVLTDEVRQFNGPLLEAGGTVVPVASLSDQGETTRIDRGDQRYVFLRFNEVRPRDLLKDVLGDDAYRDFAIVVDPYTVVVGESTDVPLERRPHSGSCS